MDYDLLDDLESVDIFINSKLAHEAKELIKEQELLAQKKVAAEEESKQNLVDDYMNTQEVRETEKASRQILRDIFLRDQKRTHDIAKQILEETEKAQAEVEKSAQEAKDALALLGERTAKTAEQHAKVMKSNKSFFQKVKGFLAND